MMEAALDSKRIAEWLRNRNLSEIVAFILDATGPLNALGAQAAYLAAPLMGGQKGVLHELACILEDPCQVRMLIGELKQEIGADG